LHTHQNILSSDIFLGTTMQLKVVGLNYSTIGAALLPQCN